MLASWGHALASPAALFRLPRRSWGFLALYLGASALLLGGIGLLLRAHRGDLQALLYAYLFPEGWHGALDLLLEHFFQAQQRVVLINAVITASLVAVTVLLFPVKEWLSASFERHAGLTDQPAREHPLLQQAWQESKLFLLFIAVQGAIFLLGYPPVPALKTSAAVLGYLFLFFTFAVDFVSPVLQRHQGYYSQILRLLARHPLAALGFGAMFALPTIGIGKLWAASPAWSWTWALFLVFGVNVLCIAWAAVAGTWLGARLLPALAGVARAGSRARGIAWAVVLALLAANAYVYGNLALSAHHKSQVLKCGYEIDFGSFDLERPALATLLEDEVTVGVGFDVRIDNPTRFDVDIEDSEVVVEHRGAVVARTRLGALAVPAGQARTQRVDLSLTVDPRSLTLDRGLIDPKTWRITLYIDVTPYLRVPVYLLHPDAP